MTSKKGIGLTAGILVAITATSFLIWSLPENSQMTLVVSDFGFHLDNVKNIHEVITETVDIEFQKLLNEEISAQEYIEQAERSSSQINSQIIQIIESNPPNEWQESYSNYLESLRNFNSYLRETIVIAEMIEKGEENSEIQEAVLKADEIKQKSTSLTIASDNARP